MSRNSGLIRDDKGRLLKDGKEVIIATDFKGDKILTTQADAKEADINNIVSRINKGAVIMSNAGQPFYGDVSDLGGLQEAYMKVQEAEDLFMQYPWDLRERFDNDPNKFVEFMSDPKNLDEAIKLGLANKRPVEAVPEPPASGSPAGAEVKKPV